MSSSGKFTLVLEGSQCRRRVYSGLSNFSCEGGSLPGDRQNRQGGTKVELACIPTSGFLALFASILHGELDLNTLHEKLLLWSKAEKHTLESQSIGAVCSKYRIRPMDVPVKNVQKTVEFFHRIQNG